MNGWPDWYQDLNTFEVAAEVYTRLFPYLLAPAIISNSVMGIWFHFSAQPPENYFSPAAFLGILIINLVATLVASATGLLSLLLIGAMNWLLGKWMSPISYAATYISLAMIPTIIGWMLRWAFDYSPASIEYFYLFCFGTISIAAISGAVGARFQIMNRHCPNRLKFQFGMRQLLVVMMVIGILLALSYQQPIFLIPIGLYAVTVAIVVGIFRLAHRLYSTREVNSENSLN